MLLVLGAHGQVGWELMRRGSAYGGVVKGLGRAELDIARGEEVSRIITSLAPKIVVNAAAYTAVDRAEEEPALAFAVNRDGPGHIAAACARLAVPLIHISTDYVFDGNKPAPYKEEDVVHPLGVYGHSKAAGEDMIRSRHDLHLILRTAWVFGVHGHNFVKTILRLCSERSTLRVVSDQRGCPTAASDLAGAILAIADRIRLNQNIPWGTYHFSGADETTWYEFARAIAARSDCTVVPVPTEAYPTRAPRPRNSVLDCSLAAERLGVHARPWRVSLAEVLDELDVRNRTQSP